MKPNRSLLLIQNSNSIVDPKRLRDEEDEDEEDEGEDNEGGEDEMHRRKRQRTSAPVREIIEEELAKLEALKARLCHAYGFKFQIPEILHNVFGIGGEYHLTTKLCTDPAQVVESIDEIAEKLTHSIIKTEENNWIFVTQVEVYVKERQVDDVAIVTEFDEVCPKLATIRKKATEGKGAWREIRILLEKC